MRTNHEWADSSFSTTYFSFEHKEEEDDDEEEEQMNIIFRN